MSTDLVEKALDKVQITRTQSGDLRLPRYTANGAIILLNEKCQNRDYAFVSLDEWARTFLGTVSKTTRQIAKGQIGRCVRSLQETDWLVVADYDGQGRLVGIIYVRSIPDNDEDGIYDLVRDRMDVALKRSEMNQHRFDQLSAKLSTVKCPPVE